MDDYLNIQIFTRQAIHNWLHTVPQDPTTIATFRPDINERCKLAPVHVLDGDIAEQCEVIPINHEEDEENLVLSNQIAMLGIKVRDYAFNPAIKRQETTAESIINNYPPITIFNAYTKSCFFLYLRWVYKQGFYDRPPFALTITDVDRLLSCGAISVDMLDFPLGRSMAAYGAYSRHNELNKSRPAWTVCQGAKLRPTDEELSQFIIYMENIRYLSGTRKLFPYRIGPRVRPRIPENYEDARKEVHGYWGLLESGISDELCLSLIQTKDKSFLDPEIYANNRELVWSRNGETCTKAEMYRQNALLPPKPPMNPVLLAADDEEVMCSEAFVRTEKGGVKPIKSARPMRRFLNASKRILKRVFSRYKGWKRHP